MDGPIRFAKVPLLTYSLTLQKKPAYLHAIVTGRNSRENVERYLAEVFRECQALGCSRLLVEERLEGPRLGALEVFEVVSRGANLFVGVATAIAYVDANAVGDVMTFAEDVAVNRSIPLRVFPSVDEAEQWLLR
jgi:hypothetical protein